MYSLAWLREFLRGPLRTLRLGRGQILMGWGAAKTRHIAAHAAQGGIRTCLAGFRRSCLARSASSISLKSTRRSSSPAPKRFADCLRGGDDIESYCKEIFRREAEADEVTRQVLVAVRRTFITPFDRTDIQDLITSMDDAIDQMNKTAKTTVTFEVRSFEPCMQENRVSL